MVKQSIQIFARVKPTKAKQGLYEITGGDEASPLLHFTVPKDLAGGFVNNKKEVYKFSFEKVFDQNAKQDEIFNSVAKPVIDNVLAGYNGTIFAYGQTGSGKTFTITGGAERFMDRGIIPRTLSYIFDYFEKNPGNEYNTYISYLELYNESGYDLLDPKHEAAKLEDLPKVSLMEDNDQNIHLKNLSTHNANNEEEALNLLFLGDTNRMIAETPMNQASTRSHCIFTVHVSSREVGSATIRRSKLHLVDLAGSERVSKTGVNGTLLTEAKYINLSLHYLEQVIVALAEKSRQHIPYRNSMMTSVLRDSLGGNCMTTMIATCSVEKKNVDESISTCRFAQRVALIKNDATLNEELDPKLMIQRLKKEVAQLKDELNMATGEQRTDALTEEDIERCRDAVKYYLEDPDMDAMLRIGADMRLIQECFRILKGHALQKGPRWSSQASLTPAPEHTPRPLPMAPADSTEAKKLRDLIRQRDNEINILVNMLKKEKKRAADAIGRLENLGQPVPRASSNISESSVPVDTRSSVMTNGGASVRQQVREARSMSVNTESLAGRKVKDEKEEKIKTKILGDMSMGRQEAFEIFRRDYPQNPHIEENKRILKQKYAEAKSLGESVNQSRKKMNKLKASIEQHRMSRVMQGLVDPENPEPDEMEQEIRSQMEHEKASYRDCFSSLRNLKTEIEHLQHLMEKDKVKLMKDFEIWWAEQAASVQAQQDVLKGPKTKAAWRTPPLTPSHSKQVFSVSASQSSLASDSPINKGGGEPRIEAASTGTNSAYTSGYGSHNSDHSHRGNGHRSSKAEKSSSSIPMTGDAQADADIMAFLKARKNILKHAQSQGQR